MQKAIGEVINKNLEKIRRDLIAKGEVELTETLGYKTGQGWIGSAQKVQQGSQTVYQRTGYVWNTNLRGVTIIIRPRKNYVTGADNFESWYVHTAYPQLAR